MKDTYCPKCKELVTIDSYYNFTSHNHPIYYCKLCDKYFAFFGNTVIQSDDNNFMKEGNEK